MLTLAAAAAVCECVCVVIGAYVYECIHIMCVRPTPGFTMSVHCPSQYSIKINST